MALPIRQVDNPEGPPEGTEGDQIQAGDEMPVTLD